MNEQAPSEFWQQHLSQQQAILQELRALKAAQQEQAAKLQMQEQGLKHLVSLIRWQTEVARATMLAGITAADGRHADPLSLTRAYAQIYSQNGEDGMTAEIFRRIGTRDRFFVEIGIENELQCNTRLLLETGWRGVWLEGSEKKAQEASQYFRSFVDSGALKIVLGMIGPENIEVALDQMEVPACFDYLSLDIDQHTHSVWRAMKRRVRRTKTNVRPAIARASSGSAPHCQRSSCSTEGFFQSAGSSLRSSRPTCSMADSARCTGASSRRVGVPPS